MFPARGALAAALIASLAIAAPAAEAAKKPKSAKYNLIIEGTQVTTWDYQKKQQPSCDWPEAGGGEQKIRFFIGKAEPKVPVKVVAEGKGVAIEPTRVEMAADAVMKANWARYYTQQSPCGNGGGTGGGGTDGKPQDDVGSASCVALGQIDMVFGTSRDELYQPGDPMRPPGADPKNAVIARGLPMWDDGGSYHTLPGACTKDGEPNADIGITVSRGEWAGGLIEFLPKMSAKKLLVAKPKKAVTVKGSVTLNYPNEVQTEQPQDVTTGKTVLNYTLKFVPRKK